MKDIEKIIADLQAWVEEDKEESYSCKQHTLTQGFMGFLVDAFQKVLNDNDPENGSEEGKEADHE